MNEKTYKQHLTVWIIVTIVLVGISFYAGDKHGQSSARSAMASMRGGFAGGTAGGAAGAKAGTSRFGTGGGAITGSVLSKDDTSLTVQGRDGSSKIIIYSGSTQIMKTSSGSASDVSVGSQVVVQGTQNSDGSITAQSIQIRPDMPAGSGTPASSAGTAPAASAQ